MRWLIRVIKDHLWKHAWHEPERVKHVVGEDGSHTISMRFAATDVEWVDPDQGRAKLIGLTTPDMRPTKKD